MLHPVIILGILLLLIFLAWLFGWYVWCLLFRWATYLSGYLSASTATAGTRPVRAYLSRKLPRTYSLLCNRLRPDRFSGLPLSLLLLIAGYIAILLSGIVEEIVEAEEISALDSRISELLEPLRDPVIVEIFRWITGFGDLPALISVAVVASAFLWIEGKHNSITGLWISVIGANITTYLGKYGFDRDRPDFVTDITVHTASFPSGHATASVAVFGYIAYTIIRDLPATRQRYEVIFWSLILIALIGFSRIFLNVHHSSDVAAGFLVGSLWLLIGIMVSEYLQSLPHGHGKTGHLRN